jgi:hypothetical protein
MPNAGRTATPRIQAPHAQGRAFLPAGTLAPAEDIVGVLNAIALPWTAEVMDISLRPMQKSY